MKIVLTKEQAYSGSLILVTPEIPLRKFPEISELKPIFIPENAQMEMHRSESWSAIRLQKRAAAALQGLLEAIDCKNEIAAVSGFRTQEEQEEIWRDSMAKNGEAFTRKFVAVPGHSEHQSGYAVDLAENAPEIDEICPVFPYRGIFQKFRERMASFGFVERYPAGKEAVTGIGAEPWHFRYVGYPHSVVMADRGMVLEEYIEFLRKETRGGCPYAFRADGNRIDLLYLSLEHAAQTVLELPQGTEYWSSGTNEGGVIVSMAGKQA